jgi:hypothetical protein
MKTAILHLTVSADGYISLWDKPGMGGHGTNLELELTPEQQARVVAAMASATENIGDGQTKGPYYQDDVV